MAQQSALPPFDCAVLANMGLTLAHRHGIDRPEQVHCDHRCKLANRLLQRIHFQHLEQCVARGRARRCGHNIDLGGYLPKRSRVGVEGRRDCHHKLSLGTDSGQLRCLRRNLVEHFAEFRW